LRLAFLEAFRVAERNLGTLAFAADGYDDPILKLLFAMTYPLRVTAGLVPAIHAAPSQFRDRL
jgi:hypothetical protein